jgi:hypothetical protein
MEQARSAEIEFAVEKLRLSMSDPELAWLREEVASSSVLQAAIARDPG